MARAELTSQTCPEKSTSVSPLHEMTSLTPTSTTSASRLSGTAPVPSSSTSRSVDTSQSSGTSHPFPWASPFPRTRCPLLSPSCKPPRCGPPALHRTGLWGFVSFLRLSSLPHVPHRAASGRSLPIQVTHRIVCMHVFSFCLYTPCAPKKVDCQ
jgi:hypothetical protein